MYTYTYKFKCHVFKPAPGLGGRNLSDTTSLMIGDVHGHSNHHFLHSNTLVTTWGCAWLSLALTMCFYL